MTYDFEVSSNLNRVSDHVEIKRVDKIGVRRLGFRTWQVHNHDIFVFIHIPHIHTTSGKIIYDR